MLRYVAAFLLVMSVAGYAIAQSNSDTELAPQLQPRAVDVDPTANPAPPTVAFEPLDTDVLALGPTDDSEGGFGFRIPEPAAMAIVGLGAVALLAHRRRKSA